MTIRTLLICTALYLTFNASAVLASADDSEHTEAPKGPHGGTLLSDARGLTLEVTIFNRGIPPEMRIFAYRDGEPLSPSELDVNVRLNRLGGEVTQLTFAPEDDYLVSGEMVPEPHSFEVSVIARSAGLDYQWQYDNPEGRTQINEREQQLAELTTERAGPMTLVFTDTLFGVIAAVADQVYRVNAPYPGMVVSVYVNVGDRVKEGQKVATLRNTQTLQNYDVTSPANGEVTARSVNTGDRADDGALVEITDLSQVWVELSAFPEDIEKLATGQAVTAYDLHHHEVAHSTISYIAPSMTGGHIARARATIPNPEGHWRPGMHLKADVETGRRNVPLAIRNSALQTIAEQPVVFARYGNTFEVRMLELGDSTEEFSEVLSGLQPDTEYVTNNSFVLKADILKGGVSHDH
ncbi:Cobalt-zinc-cadmium resistance protein CzcB [Halioglobus japonicus]|nr:Cobalt-zinc-cadmium resistance protein CzcB [Halioglobus japonicus]